MTDILKAVFDFVVVSVIFKYIIAKWIADKIRRILGWLLKKAFIRTHADWTVFITAYQKALKKRSHQQS